MLSRIFKLLYRSHLLPFTLEKRLVAVALALIVSYWISFPLVPGGQPSQQAAELLSLNAQLLAAVFAITLSLTIIGVQYLSHVYTPRSVRNYFSDPLVIGFLILYTLSILFHLTALTFRSTINLNILALPSLLLVTFCLVYLFAYPFHVVRKLQPEDMLRTINKEIPKNLFDTLSNAPSSAVALRQFLGEPITILDQMLIRSIRENDFEAYRKEIQLLTKMFLSLLEEARKEYEKEKKLDLLAARTDTIVAFFTISFDQIKTECYNTHNRLFLSVLISKLTELLVALHQSKAIRSIRLIYDIYEDIGLKSIQDGMVSVAEEFCKSLERVVSVEMSITHQQVSPFESESISWNKLEEEQRNNLTFNTILFHYLEGRIDFIKQLLTEASNKRYESVVNSLLFTYSKMLDDTIDVNNVRLRVYLLREIAGKIEETYKYAADKGIRAGTFTTGMFHYRIEKMEKRGIPAEEQLFLVKKFCDMSLHGVIKDDFGALLDLGVNGRRFVKNRPDLAEIVVEILGKCLSVTKSAKEPKIITDEMVAQELRSIRDWSGHQHTRIRETVDRILGSIS